MRMSLLNYGSNASLTKPNLSFIENFPNEIRTLKKSCYHGMLKKASALILPASSIAGLEYCYPCNEVSQSQLLVLNDWATCGASQYIAARYDMTFRQTIK